MATLQELSDFHEEAIEVIGHLVRDFKAIDGDENPALLEKMVECVDQGRDCFLRACACLDELMELKREAE
jgi:hypothetical protein